MKPAFPDIVAAQAHPPDARLHAHEGAELKVGREIDSDVVGPVGRVVQLVVDRNPRVPLASRWFSMNSPGLTSNQRVHARRLQQHRNPVLRAVPDLELVLRDIRDAVADDGPVEIDFETRGRHRAAGVNATHDPAEVIFALGGFLTRVSRGDAHRPARRGQQRVDPPAGAARPIVSTAIRSERDVHRQRQPLLLRDAYQVFDGVNDAARVAEGRTAALALVRRAAEHR